MYSSTDSPMVSRTSSIWSECVGFCVLADGGGEVGARRLLDPCAQKYLHGDGIADTICYSYAPVLS